MLSPSPDFVRRVCAHSGCARSTLLVVLSNPARAREASRLRIQRAISELGLTEQAAQYAPGLALTSADPVLGIASGGRLIA